MGADRYLERSSTELPSDSEEQREESHKELRLAYVENNERRQNHLQKNLTRTIIWAFRHTLSMYSVVGFDRKHEPFSLFAKAIIPTIFLVTHIDNCTGRKVLITFQIIIAALQLVLNIRSTNTLNGNPRLRESTSSGCLYRFWNAFTWLFSNDYFCFQIDENVRFLLRFANCLGFPLMFLSSVYLELIWKSRFSAHRRQFMQKTFSESLRWRMWRTMGCASSMLFFAMSGYNNDKF